jgi:hypothetical protein
VPFEVTLHRVARLDAKVGFVRFSRGSLEDRRRDRLQRALKGKLPKVESYRRGGAFSVLVLEDDDIALSNEALVATAVEEALKAIGVSPPDAILLVDTSTRTMWFVVCLSRLAIDLA